MNRDFNRYEKTYVALAGLFAVVLVLTNIIGTKLFVAFSQWYPEGLFGVPLTLTSGIITYPITFLLTDVVSEIYGKKRANFMVGLGFFVSLFMLLVIQIVLPLEGSMQWVNSDLGFDTPEKMQLAFKSVFTLPGVLIFASMTAYLVSQLLDVRLYHFWKNLTQGKHLWLRNNGSTWISQLVDTIIVNLIFLSWGLGLDSNLVLQITAGNYLVKIIFALLDTPVIYCMVSFLRSFLGIKSQI